MQRGTTLLESAPAGPYQTTPVRRGLSKWGRGVPLQGPSHTSVARTALIVKLAAVGDVVMALPMVTALRAEDPDIRITWMCGRKAAPLVRLVEGVERGRFGG